MSEFIAATERLIIRQIEDGDQDLVYNLSQESSLIRTFASVSPNVAEYQLQKATIASGPYP